MGMFDGLYDADGNEWQTKAFDCGLYKYQIGDVIPFDQATTFQVKVLGGPNDAPSVDSFATVLDAVLVAVPAERDERLPLFDYFGAPIGA